MLEPWYSRIFFCVIDFSSFALNCKTNQILQRVRVGGGSEILYYRNTIRESLKYVEGDLPLYLLLTHLALNNTIK